MKVVNMRILMIIVLLGNVLSMDAMLSRYGQLRSASTRNVPRPASGAGLSRQSVPKTITTADKPDTSTWRGWIASLFTRPQESFSTNSYPTKASSPLVVQKRSFSSSVPQKKFGFTYNVELDPSSVAAGIIAQINRGVMPSLKDLATLSVQDGGFIKKRGVLKVMNEPDADGRTVLSKALEICLTNITDTNIKAIRHLYGYGARFSNAFDAKFQREGIGIIQDAIRSICRKENYFDLPVKDLLLLADAIKLVLYIGYKGPVDDVIDKKQMDRFYSIYSDETMLSIFGNMSIDKMFNMSQAEWLVILPMNAFQRWWLPEKGAEFIQNASQRVFVKMASFVKNPWKYQTYYSGRGQYQEESARASDQGNYGDYSSDKANDPSYTALRNLKNVLPGVSEGSSAIDTKRAFNNYVMKNHPDKNKLTNKETFKNIMQIYNEAKFALEKEINAEKKEQKARE